MCYESFKRHSLAPECYLERITTAPPHACKLKSIIYLVFSGSTSYPHVVLFYLEDKSTLAFLAGIIFYPKTLDFGLSLKEDE